ncbi:hypothetical protein RhiirC2_774764 [Rhizophagus irregularis]|uniref:Uncharacterized protein n=1 Tax=Rhizophagus irregularis TaxID=588596 RepID=A0A2N1NKN8_9GLOM|nr:hypothetical protein RhiirC2_774764 [Rhizophagus irregularis]
MINFKLLRKRTAKSRNWTSGNSYVDEFIKYTQLTVNKNIGYLEWIDFNKLYSVKNTNKRGAFGSIYTAIWMKGPWWSSKLPIRVTLERLDNFHNITQEHIYHVSTQTVHSLVIS